FAFLNVGWYLMVVSLVAIGVGEPLAQHFVSKRLAEKADTQTQASVLDSLPFRLPAAVRRWDPFYLTQHHIVPKLHAPLINAQRGIAFTAEALPLDKQPVLQTDIAPRDEVRENGVITGIRYEVPDFVRQARENDNFTATGPGVDRLDFTRTDPVNEPTLVTL